MAPHLEMRLAESCRCSRTALGLAPNHRWLQLRQSKRLRRSEQRNGWRPSLSLVFARCSIGSPTCTGIGSHSSSQLGCRFDLLLPISKPKDIRVGPHPPYIPGLETCELRRTPPTSLVWKLANPLGKNCTSKTQGRFHIFFLVFAVKLDVKHSGPAVVVLYWGVPTATWTKPPQIIL